MNRKHGTIAVAFVLGAFAAFGVLKLALPTVAAAQTTNQELAQKLNELEKRIALLEKNQSSVTGIQLPATPGPLHPGSPPVTSGLQNAQVNQVVVLQDQIDALKNQLGKLQTQFATHHHTVTVASPRGWGVETFPINCPGPGQSCTSSVSITQLTVLVPPNIHGPTTPQTVNSSGPVMGGN
jgi:cell division protein FtsB